MVNQDILDIYRYFKANGYVYSDKIWGWGAWLVVMELSDVYLLSDIPKDIPYYVLISNKKTIYFNTDSIKNYEGIEMVKKQRFIIEIINYLLNKNKSLYNILLVSGENKMYALYYNGSRYVSDTIKGK